MKLLVILVYSRSFTLICIVRCAASPYKLDYFDHKVVKFISSVLQADRANILIIIASIVIIISLIRYDG